MKRFAGRLNWKHSAIIMTLVTIIPPYTTFLLGFGGHDHRVSTSVFALLWAINPPGASGLQVLTGLAVSMGITIGFFNILFAFQVVRYTREEVGKTSTLAAAVLTLFLPLTSLIVTLPYLITYPQFVYIGPIPVQLITGLLLMRVARQPDPTQPWDDEE